MLNTRYVKGVSYSKDFDVICRVLDDAWIQGDRGNIFNSERLRTSTIKNKSASAVGYMEMLHEVDGFEELYYDYKYRYFIFRFGNDNPVRYCTYVALDDDDDEEIFRC
jgi:hypothetical protein